MSRNAIHVREATPEDAEALLQIWSDLSRRTGDRGSSHSPEAEARNAVARSAADPDERLVVGTVEGVVVGATQLVRVRVSPLTDDAAIYVSHLHVLPTFRKHGVGKALLESALTWAEEKDTAHLLVAASVHSRDANRFMARLGLGQLALVRVAGVAALRGKLPLETPACARVTSRTHRSVGQVIAQRRSQRRAQAKPQELA